MPKEVKHLVAILLVNLKMSFRKNNSMTKQPKILTFRSHTLNRKKIWKILPHFEKLEFKQQSRFKIELSPVMLTLRLKFYTFKKML